jgi:hypothetical protein
VVQNDDAVELGDSDKCERALQSGGIVAPIAGKQRIEASVTS